MVRTNPVLLVGANLVFAQGDHKDRPYRIFHIRVEG